MNIFALVTIIFGIILLVLGSQIAHGYTYLIHDYHQASIKEEDKKGYGTDFSKGMYGIAFSFLASGIVSIFTVI